MAELINEKKRVLFPAGAQKQFILETKEGLGLTWNELAKLVNVSTRHLIDWKNEKFSMTLKSVSLLCKKLGSPFPPNIQIKDAYWYVIKGARKGGIARYKKYGSIGDPQRRLKNWQEWWNTKGRFQNKLISQPLHFNKPRFSSKLAEAVGIILGDGRISKNQLSITLHCIDDAEYAEFVIDHFYALFGVKGKRDDHVRDGSQMLLCRAQHNPA